jgi:5'-3' exonuclease, N-terminal resolvase-like domain
MTNLIFDLNNIAHRSMFVVSGYSTKFTFDSQSEIDKLMRKLAMDVAYLIRLINPARVIFALDDKSWRKTIKIDENDGYKAQRTKAAHINWNNVYNALSEFSEIMENNGMIVTKIKSAEADDVCALWSHELQFNQTQHAIIVSGDEDMRQLAKAYNYDTHVSIKKIAFTTIFNPFMQGKNASRKLYVPKYFEEWLNDSSAVDFMNMKGSIDVDKEDFKRIISSERTKMEVVDGRMIALRKMFCGDDGDNVPAIYTWINDKGVETRITNSKFEKIYESITFDNETKYITHNDIRNRGKLILEELKKIAKQNITIDINKRIERQAKLVVLDKNLFPEEIVKSFEELKQKELDKPRVNYGSLNMQNLLEGTRYVREKNTESEASIFKEIDRIKGNALF